MSFLERLLPAFALPVTAERVAAHQLRCARILQLEHAALAEEHAALAEMYAARIRRLAPTGTGVAR